MGAEVFVLVTCTNRKTVDPPAALMLRAVPGRVPGARAASWIHRLQTARVERLPAASLYAGDHWHVVRSIHQHGTRKGWRVSVWVCSAGYGLIPMQAEIAPYAATFVPNHPDSVSRGAKNGEASAARREWWTTLAAWPGPTPGAARTLCDLISGRKNRYLLVASSPQYLDAVTDDLERAAETLGPERLTIFSAGTDSHPTLGNHLVPCDARLQRVLGGALNSLNARCVRYALEHLGEDGPQRTVLHTLFSRLLQKLPKHKPPQRSPLSDEDVCIFIKEALSADATVRPTALLRRLRESERACEQKRFGTLFRQVEGGRHG